MKLDAKGQRDYKKLINAINSYPAGTSFTFSSIIPGRTFSPILAKNLREEVIAGRVPGVTMITARSRDGYFKN